MPYKLTYSTMFDPPAELHLRFDEALREVSETLGATHALYIEGKDIHAQVHREARSPSDRDLLLGHFSQATAADAERAIAAAHGAFPAWRSLAAGERIRILRGVAQLIEQR